MPSCPKASFAQCPRPGTGTDNFRHVLPSATADTPYSLATFNRGCSHTLRKSSSRSYCCSTVSSLSDDVASGLPSLSASVLRPARQVVTAGARSSVYMDSESHQRIGSEFQMLLHSRCPQESVHPLGRTSIVLPKHSQQLNGHIGLTLKKRSPKGIHVVRVVRIPGRTMSK